MTNVERSGDVGRLLEGCRHIFLDFDGPVCSIFAGVGAPSVAAKLRDLLAESVPLPEELTQVDDPLEILRFTASLPAGFRERVERELRSSEITAARSARPTPGAEEFMMAATPPGAPSPSSATILKRESGLISASAGCPNTLTW